VLGDVWITGRLGTVFVVDVVSVDFVDIVSGVGCVDGIVWWDDCWLDFVGI
jgi:hypothetical protein